MVTGNVADAEQPLVEVTVTPYVVVAVKEGSLYEAVVAPATTLVFSVHT